MLDIFATRELFAVLLIEVFCEIRFKTYSRTIPHGNRLQLQLYTDGCASSAHEKVVFLEHVQAIINLSAPKRGDIQIYLISPSGICPALLS